MRLFSIFFLIGTLLIQFLSEVPSLLFGTLLVTGSIIVAAISKTRFSRFYPFVLLAVAFSIGLFLAGFSAQKQLNQQLHKQYEGVDLIVKGKIIDIPVKRGDGLRFRFELSKAFLAQDPSNDVNVSGIVRLGWYQKFQQLHAGETWQLRIRLKRPSGFINPAGFDYEKWLFTERISATGYVRKTKSNEHQLLQAASWWSVNHIRENIHNSIQTSVENKSSAAVLSALVVAIRTNLSDDQWKKLSETGTTHLVAISGLHIAVVAGFAFFPIMLLWRLFPRLNELIPVQVAGGIAGVVFAVLYALLAGFTLPTQRALLMVIIGVFGLVSQKNYTSFTILAGALIAVLILDPLAGLTASFWLSFLAVSLILIFLNRQIEPPKYQLIKLQFLLSLGMLPLTLLFFGTASLSSPIANFFAIPWVSLIIVPLSLMALILIPISSFLSDALFKLAAITIDWLFKGLELLSGSPLTSIHSAEIPKLYLMIAFAGLLFLLLPKGFPARWLGLIAFIPALFFSTGKLTQGEFEYTLLDAGQGMASVLHTQNHTLIYDTGTRLSDSFDIGKLVLVPYLKLKGLDRVDTMIISHDDLDHSGGAASVLKEISINEILSSSDKVLVDHSIRLCKGGQKWQWDGINFEILSPLDNYPENDNNQSCVLKVSNEYHSLLITGDIEHQTEKLLINDKSKSLKSEVMIVPHHGSKTSSTEEFIEAVSPQLALIPVGYRSRFGHPKEEVVERYSDSGIGVMNTAISGAITVSFPKDKQDLKVESYRMNNKGFWNRD